MKKITKRALSMTVSGLLLMNTFTATVFADNNHEEFENNGHGYGHEWNKDWFENGHDNGHHGHKNDQGQEEEFVIEDLDQEEPVEEQFSEEEQSEQPAEEQQVEETEQNEESQQEEQAEETEQSEEPQQEEQAEETEQSEEPQQEEEIAEEEASKEEISEENNEAETEETVEEEVSEDPSSVVENSAEAVQEALNEVEEETGEEAEEAVEEETEEEAEEVVEEETEEPEEAPWESYTLYNYISLNEGTTYISLNTQENGITAPKPAAEFHRENGNKRYDLSEDEYEIEEYDLTELVITTNGIRFVEQSVAKEGQAYFIARLDRVEAVAAAPFRASSCVEDIESFISLGSKVITFHRNWYLTLVTPEIQMVSGQKLLTGVKMPDNKYYGIDYTDNFKAVDSRTVAYGAKLSEDQYEIEDYDFTNLTLTYKSVEYAYRPDGPVAGDGNGFHYYTVKFLKLDKVNKSTYGGGYLIEGWPTWPLTNANAADPDGFPYTAGYYHRDYTVTLHVGDAPAAPAEEEITPVVEETEPVEEVTPVIEKVEPVEEEVTPVIEEVEPVEEEVTPAIEEVEPVEEEQIVEEETTPSIIEEAAAAVGAIKAIIEETVEEAEEVPAAVIEETVEEAEEVPEAVIEETVEEAEEVPAAVIEETVEEVEEVPAAVDAIKAIIEETVEEAEEVPATVVEEVAEEAEEAPAAVIEEVAEEAEEAPAAAIEEVAEEAEEAPAAVIEEVAEEIEEAAAAAEEVRKPRRQQNHDEILAFTDPVVASDSTANVEAQIIEDAEIPMTIYMAAVEAEEILEEELPMAAAPFEAVTVADNTEAVQAADTEEISGTETEEPTFVAVASMQVADFVEMTETEAPQAAAGTWSLASLIFTCMTILLAVFSIASKTASRKIKALAAVIAAASAAIFLLTSDLSGMMITADRWTLAIVILNIFEAVFASTATNEVRRG